MGHRTQRNISITRLLVYYKKILAKEMTTHSSIPAWRIPWTEEPSGLQSMEVTGKLDTSEQLNNDTNKRVELHTTHKSNSRWTKNLNLRSETIKILEENLDDELLVLSLRNDFLDLTLKGKAAKAKTNKEDYIKLKTYGTKKKTIQNWKRKYLQILHLIRYECSKYIKECPQLTIKEKNNPKNFN